MPPDINVTGYNQRAPERGHPMPTKAPKAPVNTKENLAPPPRGARRRMTKS